MCLHHNKSQLKRHGWNTNREDANWLKDWQVFFWGGESRIIRKSAIKSEFNLFFTSLVHLKKKKAPSPDRSRLFSFCCSSPTARGCCSGLQRKPPWSWRRAPRCRAERTKPSSPWSGSSRTPRGISPPGRWAPCHSELSPPQRSQSSWAPVRGSSPCFFFCFFFSPSLALSLSPSFFLSPLRVTAVAAPTVSCATPSFRVLSAGLPRLQTPSDALIFSYWVQKCAISERDVHPKENQKRNENQKPFKPNVTRRSPTVVYAPHFPSYFTQSAKIRHKQNMWKVWGGKRFQSSSRWIVHSPHSHSEQRVWQQMFPQWWCCVSVCVRAPASTLRTHRSYN